ncbi:MAG: PepSY-like domain-containing protein [Muribaculaceae bacterium]|nr:PepSY-like domain-containing protein [Muribaculaceae bacterium]
MRRTLVWMLAGVMASVGVSAYAGTPINESELPKGAGEFIAKHFGSAQIKKAEKDDGRRGMEYEVKLTNGAEVEFNADGSWRKVEAAKGEAVPAELVPEAIAKYVAANHAGQVIKEISTRRDAYKIELSNDTELMLTKDGKLMQPRHGKGGPGGRPNGPRR